MSKRRRGDYFEEFVSTQKNVRMCVYVIVIELRVLLRYVSSYNEEHIFFFFRLWTSDQPPAFSDEGQK